MAKKLMTFKTKGMNRDLSVSAFNPEFAFENINLRLSTNENNTLLSWVNEKGTLPIKILDNAEIKGIPIGIAVIDHKLILFTTDWIYENKQDDSPHDYIYKLTYEDTYKTIMNLTCLYNGSLNFSTRNPLETLVSYEAEKILKVYWVDGRNQPRMINIEGTIKPNIDTLFDFVPVIDTLSLQVTIVNKVDSGGTFAPGVILYVFTYLNKHGLESNVAYVSPLYYLAHEERGESPEGKVANTFIIKILGADTNFDYVRVYSVQRTSLNDTPYVRRLEDLMVTGLELTYIDNGTTGATLDPMELLYVGGKEITALTMIDKDNTLFLGNLKEKNNDVSAILDFIDNERETKGYTPLFNGVKTFTLPINGFYPYDNLLENSNKDITTFKGGEYYRLGFLLLKATGEWSEPIYLDDVKNTRYPETTLSGSVPNVTLYYPTLGTDFLNLFVNLIPDFLKIYKKVRPVIVYPNIADREVLCQGVLNPTVFNIEDRVTNSPFAQASWYFRPYTTDPDILSIQASSNDSIEDTESGKTEEDTEDTSVSIYIENVETSGYLGIEDLADESIPTLTLDITEYVDVILVAMTSSSGVLSRGYLRVQVTNLSTSETKLENIRFRSIYLGKLSVDSEVEVYALVSDLGKKWPKEIYNVRYLTNAIIYQLRRKLESYTMPAMYEDISGKYSPTAFIGLLASIFNGEHVLVDPSNSKDYDDLLEISRVISNNLNNDADDSLEGVQGLIRAKVDSIIGLYTYKYLDVRWVRPSVELDDLLGFPLYKGLESTIGTHELFYTGRTSLDEESEDSDTYVFKFAINPSGINDDGLTSDRYNDPWTNNINENRLYKVTFKKVDKKVAGKEGNNLRFGSFASLFSMDDASLDTFGTLYNNVEILYSHNEYESIFDRHKDTLSSNTLFFIDHSIVTLNSPDIEFDPIVQGYGTEGLGLRIVGAIPITSNASYHRITISSAMLESWHNYHVDTLYSAFGQGEKNFNVFHAFGDPLAGNRFISDYIWNDVEVVNNPDEEDKIHTNDIHDYLVYPWQKTGSLNNDPRTVDVASSLLKTKKESNILVSANSFYFDLANDRLIQNIDFTDIDCKLHFTENLFVTNIRLEYASNKFSNGINYYPNIDKILYSNDSEGHAPIARDGIIGNGEGVILQTAPISMKYKSTSHAVISLSTLVNEEGSNINVLPSYGEIGLTIQVPSIETELNDETSETEDNTAITYGETFWGDTISINQGSITESLEAMGNRSFLWLGELYRTGENLVRFGGTSKEALRANTWYIAGEAVSIGDVLEWTMGDTYYQRYDCLKTYAFTPEDYNLIIEILSFMCETHINIDGRYDRNRGQIDNTNMSPVNFNLHNPVYSQLNNYFPYKKLKDDKLLTPAYPNQVMWSLTKTSGADVDLWTNMTLGSVMELDGDKGEITSLNRVNNFIIAFLDSGISLILYDENALITTEEGIPVELGNSGKVTGKKYLSNTIGCSNKWSIAQTVNGIYFMDSNDKSIYLFNGEFKNITGEFGFNTWAKLNIPSSENIWTPDRFKHFISYYDKLNLEVLFIGDTKALAWNEKLGTFTAFYDYQYTPYFVNLDDTGIWIRNPYTERITNGFIEYPTSIWKHNAGEYCNFFGDIKEYSMTLVGNPEPLLDKIFTNIEFRACVDGEGYTLENGKYIPLLPFDTLETWNEYQYGTANLGIRNSHAAFKHHHSANGEDTLKRKFRVWRCDIPRDNYGKYEGFKVDNEDFNSLFFGGQSKGHPLDRMRNPWIYIKLTGNKENVKASEINKFNKKAAAVFEFTPNTSGNYYIHLGDTSFLNDYLRDLLYFETKAYVNIAEDGEDPIYQEITLLYRVNVRPYSSLGQYESIGQINASSSILDSALINTMKSIRSNNSDIDIGLLASSQQLNSYDPTKVKIEVLAYDKYSPEGTDSKTYDLLENSRVEVHDVVMTYYG